MGFLQSILLCNLYSYFKIVFWNALVPSRKDCGATLALENCDFWLGKKDVFDTNIWQDLRWEIENLFSETFLL